MAALDRIDLRSARMMTECTGQNVWLAEIK
jgi:hypothetical protein